MTAPSRSQPILETPPDDAVPNTWDGGAPSGYYDQKYVDALRAQLATARLTTKEREIVEASRGRDADTALVAIIDRLVARAGKGSAKT